MRLFFFLFLHVSAIALLTSTNRWLLKRRLGLHASEVTVNLGGGREKVVLVKDGEFLLLALEDAKIGQKSFCRTGTCGACAVRITNNKMNCFSHDEPEPGIFNVCIYIFQFENNSSSCI